MSIHHRTENPFIGYEYKEISVPSEMASLYLDCYEAFGWQAAENLTLPGAVRFTRIRLKRDRKIINKMELTRLQRHFEACAEEIRSMERSKTSRATIWAIAIGLIGTAFMAGSVFAVTAQPPKYILCILLAVPAFAGWIAPYFVYRFVTEQRIREIQPLIEAKLDELYEICEKGHSLL